MLYEVITSVRLRCGHDRLSGHRIPGTAGHLVHEPAGKAPALGRTQLRRSDCHPLPDRDDLRFRGHVV